MLPMALTRVITKEEKEEEKRACLILLPVFSIGTISKCSFLARLGIGTFDYFWIRPESCAGE